MKKKLGLQNYFRTKRKKLNENNRALADFKNELAQRLMRETIAILEVHPERVINASAAQVIACLRDELLKNPGRDFELAFEEFLEVARGRI